MSKSTAGLVKGVGGIAVVIVLLFTVSNWWGDYKTAAKRAVGVTTTSTADATGTASGPATATPTVGVVLIEGLNFRKKPDSASATIRGFKKGEKVTIIATKDGWYQAKDSKGVSGWIVAKPQYVKVTK